MDKDPKKHPTVEERRQFLKAGAALAGLLGINPVTVLTNLVGTKPMEEFIGLIDLKEKLDKGRGTLDGNFLGLFTFPGK